MAFYYLDVQRTDGSYQRIGLASDRQDDAVNEAEAVLVAFQDANRSVGQDGRVFYQKNGAPDALITSFSRPAQSG